MVSSSIIDFRPTKIDFDRASRQNIQDDFFDCPVCFYIKKDILECSLCAAKCCEGCLNMYSKTTSE